MWTALQNFIREYPTIAEIFIASILVGLAFALFGSWLKARKIQPRGFKWKVFRNEAIITAVTILVSAPVLALVTSTLTSWGLVSFNKAPAAWWMIALEYVAYFLLFDTYFYWFHRLMHKEPIYSWVHKMHHWSTSPNPLTTFSVNPLESLINGGFVPIFTSVLTLHQETMALVLPTNIIMGVYVHLGYEFFPRWWNRSWATKWFITTTFHDQHHRYFTANFGGYTTIWDRICGTMRPKFESDFERLKDRVAESRSPAFAAAESPEPVQN